MCVALGYVLFKFVVATMAAAVANADCGSGSANRVEPQSGRTWGQDKHAARLH